LRAALALAQQPAALSLSPKPGDSVATPYRSLRAGRRSALALNPSFAPTYNALSTASASAGQPQKAIEYAGTALRLSPHDPLAYAFLRDKGLGLFLLARYREAADAFRESVALNPDLAISFAMLAASAAMQGQDADARETLQRYLALPAPHSKVYRPTQDPPALRQSLFAWSLRPHL
jgi:tetratricopeptide (TPR) repeat protein